MPTTTNFGWTTPADTDLVKDGALAIRTLAGGIDTSMVGLKGGTTGQILSKTSGTDMAFTWINNDQGDLTAITAGTGISVTSGTGPIPTVAIDTATTVDKTTAQTLTNKTLTAPVISTISNTGTLTLPTSTDTLVGRATTDTLTNKTISASSNTLTGVINNTLTTTTGDIIYASAANTPARLGIGSSGQVLTVASGIPSWATAASGGGMTLINTGGTTLSGSSTSISSIPSGYVYLYLELINFKPATDDARIYVRPNNDSTASTYYNAETGSAMGTPAFNDSTWTLTLGNDDTTATNYSAWTIYNYDDSNTWKMITGYSMNNAATNPTTTVSYRSLVGFYKGTSAITSLTFHLSTGNFTSGTVNLYGVK